MTKSNDKENTAISGDRTSRTKTDFRALQKSIVVVHAPFLLCPIYMRTALTLRLHCESSAHASLGPFHRRPAIGRSLETNSGSTNLMNIASIAVSYHPITSQMSST